MTARQVTGLLLATHLAPTVAVTGYAVAAGVASGLSGGRSALLGSAVLLGQASVGWSNDAIDAARDAVRQRSDKPLVRGDLDRGTLRAAAGLALLGCVGTSLALGWIPGLIHLAAVAAAWSYNLGVKATPLSPVPYFAAFGLLLATVGTALPGTPVPPASLLLTSALVGMGAHFPNAVKDLDADLANGVLGLPQRIGRSWSMVASAACLAAGVGAFLATPRLPAPAVGVALLSLLFAAGLLAAAARRTRRDLFPVAILGALPLVIAVVLAGGVTR